MFLPVFHAYWTPHGNADFYFVELLGLDGVVPEKKYHVVIVSADGDYVSPSLSI